MSDVRLAMIEELVTRNEGQIRMMNMRASKSRQPMSDEDRRRCTELRKANDWLGKAKFCIIQAMAGLDGSVVAVPVGKCVKGVRRRREGNGDRR